MTIRTNRNSKVYMSRRKAVSLHSSNTVLSFLKGVYNTVEMTRDTVEKQERVDKVKNNLNVHVQKDNLNVKARIKEEVTNYNLQNKKNTHRNLVSIDSKCKTNPISIDINRLSNIFRVSTSHSIFLNKICGYIHFKELALTGISYLN